MRLNGYRLLHNGTPISSSNFRKNHIAPLTGERKSYQVMQGLEYMMFVCSENRKGRKRLEHEEDEEEDPSFLYEDYGVYILIHCSFFAGICTANIVKYGLTVSQSP